MALRAACSRLDGPIDIRTRRGDGGGESAGAARLFVARNALYATYELTILFLLLCHRFFCFAIQTNRCTLGISEVTREEFFAHPVGITFNL